MRYTGRQVQNIATGCIYGFTRCEFTKQGKIFTRFRVVVDIVTALFGDEAPPGWWATPLGKACAPHSSGVLDLGEAITRADTAAMLGVHPGTVSQLVHRGTLDRHPIHDGVLVGSVVDRINRLSQERTTA